MDEDFSRASEARQQETQQKLASTGQSYEDRKNEIEQERTGALKARGSGQHAVQLDHGRFYIYNGAVTSATGSEMVANAGAACISLVASGLGESGITNMGKSSPCIDVLNSGSGLQVILLGVSAYVGVTDLVNVAAGATASIMADQIVAVRGGSGGLSIPTGAAIVGDTLDPMTGQELPVTAGQLVTPRRLPRRSSCQQRLATGPHPQQRHRRLWTSWPPAFTPWNIRNT